MGVGYEYHTDISSDCEFEWQSPNRIDIGEFPISDTVLYDYFTALDNWKLVGYNDFGPEPENENDNECVSVESGLFGYFAWSVVCSVHFSRNYSEGFHFRRTTLQADTVFAR